jgi:nucleoside-diphosphate-sugar epimerase
MDPTAALEAELSEPTAEVIATLGRLAGDIVVLGAGGKMGPSLVGQLVRADRAAGTRRTITAVARFTDPRARRLLEDLSVPLVAADLLDPAAVAALPDAPNVIYLVGQKFGTSADSARTWAINAAVPALTAARYRGARLVIFSTGNVYPLTPVTGPGPSESDPVAPIGEYAQSAWAREQIFRHYAGRHRTPMAILRLNYAIEPRYGVLRDIADRVLAGQPVDLTTGFVNVIWQRDANAIAIRALEHCAVPPLTLNVTGRPAIAVRWAAEAFGRRLGTPPRLVGREADTALLSSAERSEQILGPPPTSVETMIERIAAWIERGGGSLDKPTHFQERSGAF